MDRCSPDTGSNRNLKENDRTDPGSTTNEGDSGDFKRIKKPKRLKGEDQLLTLEMP
jgi:hypothetical protein